MLKVPDVDDDDDGGGDEDDDEEDSAKAAPRAMADTEDAEMEIRRALDVVQSMIDISADRLEGLRTQCSTSAELTQQEIRTLEVIAALYFDCYIFIYFRWCLTFQYFVC